MTETTTTISIAVANEPKVTAAQVEGDCPVRLQQIGREITERLKKAKKQTEVAGNHLIAVNKLIAEAKSICDGGGFNKFRDLFCPQLGRSQAYVLHAIGVGKKTLTEHRTEERKRKQRTRATQRAATPKSGTVPDNPDPGTEAGTRTEDGEPAKATVMLERSVEQPKRTTGVASNDTISGFNSHVIELRRRICNQKVDHFVSTAVSADDLAKIGKFLNDLAKLKKPEAVGPTPAVALSGAVLGEQSAVAVVANGALETSADPVL